MKRDFESLIKLSRESSYKRQLEQAGTYPLPREPSIWAFDVQYEDEKAYAAAACFTHRGQENGGFAKVFDTPQTYESGFFASREAPLILKLLNEAEALSSKRADLLIIDGHGRAHPREFGLACWVGVLAHRHCIGAAKRSLIEWNPKTLNEERGSKVPVGKHGLALRTQDGVNPVFVSSGYAIAPEEAAELILQLSPHFRLSEPIRKADRLARDFAKGMKLGKDVWVLASTVR